MTTLLTISGSLRTGSYNRKLLTEAVELYGPAERIDADIKLPLYDGDLEARDGLPDAVTRLVDQIRSADAVAIASPEYNKAITGVLKNALDWISRDKRSVLKDKPIAVMSANAGRTGGEAGQYMLRSCLVPLGARVLAGPGVMIASAGSEFETGRLENARYLETLGELMTRLRAEVD